MLVALPVAKWVIVVENMLCPLCFVKRGKLKLKSLKQQLLLKKTIIC